MMRRFGLLAVLALGLLGLAATVQVPHNDADAYREGFVSITPMDGDMTAGPLARWSLSVRLAGLQP